MMNRILTNQRGSALLITLFLIAALSLVAMIAMDNSQIDLELSFNQINQDRSFYIADAGIKHARSLVQSTPGWNTGLPNIAFASGEYTVTVRDSFIDPALVDSVVLVSFGEVSGSSAAIEATLIPEPFYPFRYGLFADDSVHVENSVSTDSYNSDSGSYAATVVNEFGSIGSNGSITIENNPTIAGDVMSATAGGITITGSGTVLGDTSTTAPEMDFSNLIGATQFAWAETNNRAPLGMSGSYTYQAGSRDLRVAGGQVMTLESGVYVFDDITLEQSAQIKLAPGANVQLYMTGDMLMRNKSMINSGGKPGNLQVYSTGTSFTLEQSTEFTGAVIAPNVNFSLSNYTDFYGAMISNIIDVDNNPRFHYDRSLSRIQMGTTGRMIQVAWRELN